LIRTSDHRHELVVWNHGVERTYVRCLMEDGHRAERSPDLAGSACVLRLPSPLRRRYAAGPALGFLIGAGGSGRERPTQVLA
jgi:hypothetical protein